MGFLKNALKSGLAVQATRLVQRQMAKPENQRKAKELLHRVTSKRTR